MVVEQARLSPIAPAHAGKPTGKPRVLALKSEPFAADQSASAIDVGLTKPANSTRKESKIPLPFSSFVITRNTAGAATGVTVKRTTAI